MLRIGSDPSDNQVSSINIRQDNERVGVLKNPDGRYSLDVSGSINCNVLLVNGSVFEGGGGVWTQDASNNISYSLGNVGIGTTDPSYALDVSGDIRASGDMYANGDLYADSDLYASGDLYTTDGDLLLTGDISMEGDVLTTGDMVLDGSMVIGKSSFDSSGYALDVSGDMRASGDMYANGDLYADSDLYASGDLYTTDGDLLLTGDISMEGDVLTTGDMVLDGSMVIGKSSFDSSGYALDVSGAINCTELLVNGAAFQATSTTSTTSNTDISNLNVEGNLSMGASSSITVAGNLNIGVDASFASSATAFTYSYLRLLRKSNAGVDLVINGLQVWQNDENIVSNPNLTDNSLNFYDSSGSLNSTVSIGGGILENLASYPPVSTATYAWDFRESEGLTDFNGGETIALTNTSLISGTGVPFDGSTAYATVPTTVQVGGSSTFAVELYYTHTTPSSNIHFLDFYGSSNRFIIRLYSNNELNIYTSNTSGTNDSVYTLTSGSQYHVVLVWTNSTTMDFYINGNYESSHSINIVSNTATMSSQIIGANQSTTTGFSAGTIHTLRFWNEPSSFDATDVAILYANRDSLTSTISLISPTPDAITSHDSYTATYAWDFREDLTDFNGGETIALTNTSLISGTGVTFDGSTTYATVPTTVQVGGLSTFAVELYYTHTTPSSNIHFLDFFGSSTDRFIIRLYSNNELNIYTSNTSGTNDSVYTLTSGSQYHVVLVWTNSTTMDFYINGNYESSHSINILSNTATMSSQIIGANQSTTTGFSEGTIHTLRFWNEPSSFDATDVANLYANRDVLISNLTPSVSTPTSLTSIGDYAQLTFPVPPNYDDLQGIYLVSSNTTNYELEGCSIQLLDSSYETVAESEVLGEAANYLMRGPAMPTSLQDTYKYLRFVRSSANAFSSNSGAFEIGGLQVWENDIDILTNSTTDATMRFYNSSGVEDSSMSFSTLLNDVDSTTNVVSPNTFNTTTGHYGEIEFTESRSYSSLQAIYTVAPNSTDFPYSGCEIQLLDENKNVIVETGEMARVDNQYVMDTDDYLVFRFENNNTVGRLIRIYSFDVTYADGTTVPYVDDSMAYSGTLSGTDSNLFDGDDTTYIGAGTNTSGGQHYVELSFLPDLTKGTDITVRVLYLASVDTGNGFGTDGITLYYKRAQDSFTSFYTSTIASDNSTASNTYQPDVTNTIDISSSYSDINIPYKSNYLFYGPATITAGTSFSPTSSYLNSSVGYGVIDSGSSGIGNLVSWSDLSSNVVEETLTLLTSSTSSYDTSYTNTASKVGALFSSPSDIVAWSDFSTYVDDVSLNEDSLARSRSQAFALTVGEDLIVNGDTTVNGHMDVCGNVGIGTSGGVSGYALDVSGEVQIVGGLGVSGYLKVPFGSDDVSSTAFAGYIRYNDVSNEFQGYDASENVWSSLGAGSSADTATSASLIASGHSSENSYTVSTTNYNAYKFTQDGTFSVDTTVYADILIVGGGGAGGTGNNGTSNSGTTAGGGGGGGQVSTIIGVQLVAGTNYTVTIGSGGSYNSSVGDGLSGELSSFDTYEAIGGGSGGGSMYTDGVFTSTVSGYNGGGGGAYQVINSNLYAGGSGPTEGGYSGGTGASNGGYHMYGGGGGGSGGAGANGDIATHTGGDGLANDYWDGSDNYYGGGGGGAHVYSVNGEVRLNFEGILSNNDGGGGSSGYSGLVNTGGGGGGTNMNQTGYANLTGGSGIVIIRINMDQSAIASDNRLKHNEEDISGIELITKLTPQKYLKTNYLYDENYTLTMDESGNYTNLQEGDQVSEEIGLIAQDLLQIPELKFVVNVPNHIATSSFTVNYNNLFVLSIQAIKELKAEKDALQTTITQLTSRIEALENASTT